MLVYLGGPFTYLTFFFLKWKKKDILRQLNHNTGSPELKATQKTRTHNNATKPKIKMKSIR